MSQKYKEIWKLAIASTMSLALLAIAARLIFPRGIIIQNSRISIPSSSSSTQLLERKYLTIGILGQTKNNRLVKYLHSKLGDRVKIYIDGGKNFPYQQVKSRLANKKWDIAFTGSPMLSVIAKDNGYSHVARMFPNRPPYYSAALFVRKNSRIQSLADLKTTTTLALGDFNSASTFYMPVYDLYGKTLRVSVGNTDIIKMIKQRKADVGSGSFDFIKNDPDLRVIHVSKNIPGGGVYLSPQLSKADKSAIKEILLNADREIQTAANYGPADELDYSQFILISRRAEEVLACADFNRNPVNLFCGDRQLASASREKFDNVGRVNGFSFANANTIYLNLASENQKNYRIVVNRQLLNTVPNAPPPPGLVNKTIRVIGVKPISARGNLELRITQPSQLEISD